MSQSKSKTVLDFAGRPSWITTFRNNANKPSAYEIDTATDGVVYLRYDDEDESVITRITTADNVTVIKIAFGAWASRASLEYVPVNQLLTVTTDKVAKIWARI